MGTPVKFARTAPDFVFELDQLVDICISDEWGQVKARAQYASGENQYLIHYQAADKCARSAWFGESELDTACDDRYPGRPVFAAVELPEGAKVEDNLQ
ncbi:hypothetical protein CWK15_25695 [Salmonella enterica]|uniref:Uncharacterized protein n=1 Tax=Salmonella enterica TaxID=28901 RepID=A0A5V4ZAQ8_SALER|nr:hypothetical protein [Salmonella enterica]ECI3333169.1 hypothetical protein [Salmonella enterica subsp. diarizonae]ECI3628354.1 hypothetical protein [Salmonella enterica subsp. diarizonae]EDT8143954.1 hypothetical protein [Salmonella enterica subsp. diarizonae]EIU1712897.1 hypothetical protein [Salmonella enterica]